MIIDNKFIVLMVMLLFNIGFIFLLYNVFNISIFISFVLIVLIEGIVGMFFEDKIDFDNI